MTGPDSKPPERGDAPTNATMRLDQALVSRGLMPTRSRALDAIKRGGVTIGGQVVKKPAMLVDEHAEIAIDDPASGYVSRAALKLIAGLDAFGFSPEALLCLDLGTSTGGFAQVLLQRGAAHVMAVDVGHDQMHPSLLDDDRLTNIEGLNARDLTADDLGDRLPQFISADVSFISLTLALPPALELAADGARAVLLVKPQFEAGKDAIGKGGLLKDPSAAEAVAKNVADWLGSRPGWRVEGLIPSPISGGDGNREFLLAASKTGSSA